MILKLTGKMPNTLVLGFEAFGTLLTRFDTVGLQVLAYPSALRLR